jgi:hypothetical protein
MTRRQFAVAVTTGLYLAAASGRIAAQTQAVARDFDTTKATTLSGRVASVLSQFAGATYILLDVERGPGKTERWAVAGDSAVKLGWKPKTAPVKPNDMVRIAVFLARPGTNLAATVPADHAGLAEIASAGRLVHGTDITLADGQKLVFGGR